MSTRDNVWCLNATAAEDIPSWHGYCASQTMHNQWKLLGFNGLDLSSAAMQMTVCLSVLLYVARSRRMARQGLPARLVLPAYVKFLYTYIVVTAIASGVALVQSPNADGGPVNAWLCQNLSPGIIAVSVGLDWGLYHTCLEGLTFFLMQKGAGARAFKRALRRSVVIGLAFFLLKSTSEFIKFSGTQTSGFLGESDEKAVADAMQLLINVGLLLFYATIRFAPTTLFYRRPALLEYASFWVILRSTYFVAYVLKQLQQDASFCVNVLAQHVIFSCLSPIAIVAALRDDSEYWRGHTEALTSTSSSTKGHSNLNLPFATGAGNLRVSLNSGAGTERLFLSVSLPLSLCLSTCLSLSLSL